MVHFNGLLRILLLTLLCGRHTLSSSFPRVSTLMLSCRVISKSSENSRILKQGFLGVFFLAKSIKDSPFYSRDGKIVFQN